VFKNLVYIPDDNIAENTNEELYKQWKRQGFLICTSGNAVDYDHILHDQLEVYDKTYLRTVAYDEWNSSQWAIDAHAEGLPIKGYSQTVGNFNKPTKTFEMLIRQGKVIIDYNPLVRWSFNNVELKMDHNGNTKPMKGGSTNRKQNKDTNTKKIDPIIAMLEALGAYLDENMRGVSDGQVYSA
jgi:phage terminase large subunit-like protein